MKFNKNLFEAVVLHGIMWLRLMETGEDKVFNREFYKRALWGKSHEAFCPLCDHFEGRCEKCPLKSCNSKSLNQQWTNCPAGPKSKRLAKQIYDKVMIWYEENNHG